MKPIYVSIPQPLFSWICRQVAPVTKTLTIELDGTVFKLREKVRRPRSLLRR